MRSIRRTSQFKKDIKRAERRRKDLNKFKKMIKKLVQGEPLEARYKDHVLVGEYKGTRECHLEPDWLLIYEQTEEDIVLIRTGTHADLF